MKQLSTGVETSPTNVCYGAPIPKGSPRPQSADHRFGATVIGTAAALCNLPDSQFPHLGQSCRWRIESIASPMDYLPDISRDISLNRSFPIS